MSCPFILRYMLTTRLHYSYIHIISVCACVQKLVCALPVCSPDVYDLCLLKQSQIRRQITV